MILTNNADGLWQWNTGQTITLDAADKALGATAASLSADGRTAVLRAISGDTIAIPDTLLQHSGTLYVYLHTEAGAELTTVATKTFPVGMQPKPDDYVAEDEVLQWHGLEGRITELEKRDAKTLPAITEADHGRVLTAKGEKAAWEDQTAVLYTPQSLDAARQAQAQKNIGVENLAEIVRSKNLFDYAAGQHGKYLGTNGAVKDNPDRYVTDYMPVKPGDLMIASYDHGTKRATGLVAASCCYDKEKNVIAGGKTYFEQFTVPAGCAFVRYTIDRTHVGREYQIEISPSGEMTDYEQYFDEKKVLRPEIEVADTSVVCNPGIYLPQKLEIVTAKDYQIYNSQIVTEPNRVHIDWRDIKGFVMRQTPDYVDLKRGGGHPGTITLTLQVRDRDYPTVVSNVEITGSEIDTGTPVSLMCFGDSLTNHGVWEAELQRMMPNITLVGSRSRTVNDSGESPHTVYNEGRSGFTTADYISGKPYAGMLSDQGGSEEPHNRWYDGSQFSADSYFSNHLPAGQPQPDIFVFFLGMNDVISGADPDKSVENCRKMLDSIRAAKPEMPIVWVTPQLRCHAGYAEKERLFRFARAAEQAARDYTNMIYLPLLIGMDSRNNYPEESRPVNTRNPAVEKIVTDTTHPSKYGYWQISDWVQGAVNKAITLLPGTRMAP